MEDRRRCCGAALGTRPVSVVDLTFRLPKSAWRSVRWRSGTKGDMRSRFARVRVRAAHQGPPGARSRAPRSGCSSSGRPPRRRLPSSGCRTSRRGVTITDLVHLPRKSAQGGSERDYQKLKDEIGIDHYEGPRMDRFSPPKGARLAIAAYEPFLAAERGSLSPSAWPSSKPLQYPKVSDREEVPLRPGRGNPASEIASLRRLIARMLNRHLICCHACGDDAWLLTR